MAAIVRLSADIQVAKGDPARLVQALNKKENRKKLADYCAHVLVADVMESAEVSPEGAYIHAHDMSSGSCNVDKNEAKTEVLPDFS